MSSLRTCKENKYSTHYGIWQFNFVWGQKGHHTLVTSYYQRIIQYSQPDVEMKMSRFITSLALRMDIRYLSLSRFFQKPKRMFGNGKTRYVILIMTIFQKLVKMFHKLMPWWSIGFFGHCFYKEKVPLILFFAWQQSVLKSNVYL
jgi:hypothetical protein